MIFQGATCKQRFLPFISVYRVNKWSEVRGFVDCQGYTVKPVLSSHPWEAEKVVAGGRWLLNTVQIYRYMNFGQLSSGCLIQVGCLIEVTTNTGLTIFVGTVCLDAP